MSRLVRVRLLIGACIAACLLLPTASALGGDPNAGDVWVDNVGQPAGPGNEMDPHLACQNINLWGSGLADSSGSYVIDGWPPSGSQEQDYASNWSYNQSEGGSQVLDVIPVRALIDKAIANGDAPQNSQGFHFKLQFAQDPQKHKTFWVDCQIPNIATHAAGATAGQPIHDTATLSGGSAPSGTITWNVYRSSDNTCSDSLGSVSDPVSGDGDYVSAPFLPTSLGSYQWVATYSGDGGNLSVSTACNDPNEQSVISMATPSIATTASSNTAGQPVHDQAIVNGGDDPTGTITWSVYHAADTSCATPLFTSAAISVSGDGMYMSPDYTPPGVGSYEWVATYSGDANNRSILSSCSDPKEQSVIGPAPAPAISLVKLERDGSSGAYVPGPISGNLDDAIDYQMTVTDTGNTSLAITFTDARCDAGTLSAPTVVSGSFDAATNTLSPGGVLRYTCSHILAIGDAPEFTNTASVSGQPPDGPPVTASDSVVATLNLPAMTVVKLQRDGSSGAFTTGTITAKVGDTIEYEIQVTDTGNTPLTLRLSDPRCDAGTLAGPFALAGALAGNVLSPGAKAQYTCSHVLTPSDSSPFTNTATATGTPPDGPPVSGTSSVTADKQAVRPIKVLRCGAGKVKKTTRRHGRTVTACVAKRKKARVVVKRRPLPVFTG